MKRRTFVAAAGALGVGAFGFGSGFDDGLPVRVWFTEQAATYDGIRRRVKGYVDRALADALGQVSVSFGGSVPVSTENAYRLMASAEWPRLLLEDVLAVESLPVSGVNLLVTDGDMRTAPTGAGVAHLATVGGARTLAGLPPVEETPTVVGHARRWRIAQVLLHEVGHALGLGHDHGAIRLTDRGPVVTPMVSSYAWAPEAVRATQFDYEGNACGGAYPIVAPDESNLSLLYSDCARRHLRG